MPDASSDRSSDPSRLQRFVDAQDPVFAQVLAELATGAKRSHWMWFVFPQMRGLGRSATAQYYGIGSAAEAQAYWRHPVLGTRLRQCCERLAALEPKSAVAIFGSVDASKLRSCLTLFERVAPAEPLFGALIARYFDGERDPATLALLDARAPDGGA